MKATTKPKKPAKPAKKTAADKPYKMGGSTKKGKNC